MWQHAVAMIAVCVAAATAQTAPAIRTVNGELVFQASNGARLTLTNTEAEPCPTAATQPPPTTTASPILSEGGIFSGAPSADGISTDLPLASWTEAHPAEIAANSGVASVSLIGACSGSIACGVFHPRSSRSFQCELNASGTSPMLVAGTVSQGAGTGPTDSFFQIQCQIPLFEYSVPATVTVGVRYKGELVPFTGVDGASEVKLVTRVTAPLMHEAGSSTIDVSGIGFRTTQPGYSCVIGQRGGVPVTATAIVESNELLRCNISTAPAVARNMAFEVGVIDLRTNIPVPHQSSDILDASNRNLAGLVVPLQTARGIVNVDTCSDGVANNAETDVDCGGAACQTCELGRACARDSDCAGTLECNARGRRVCMAPDLDGDGQSPAQGDCNDRDPTVYAGAPELYDGKDNDCDGLGADGNWENQLATNTSKTEWEFTEIVTSSLITIRQTNQLTIWSVGRIAIGSNIVLDGGTGQASAGAYSYRFSQGGSAAPTANGWRGANAGAGCYNAGTAAYNGIGPGRGLVAACGSYGPGGSGAGHRQRGSTGGRSPSGGGPQGGIPYGNDSVPILNPGSGGGAGGYGGARNQAGSAGGGGGGAIRLISNVSVEVNSISCKGGNGGAQGRNSGDGGTGGGGSGGTIWLEAPTVTVNGAVDVRGGSGGRIYYRGGTGGQGSPGRVWVVANTFNMRGSAPGGQVLRQRIE